MEHTWLSKKRLLLGLLVAALAFVLVACGGQPQAAVDTSEGDQAPATTESVTWSMESDCASCHQSQAATTDDEKCLAGFHVKQESARCVTCHTDEAGLASVHENASVAPVEVKRLKSTAVEDETCLGCHGPRESLVEKTVDSVVLQDHKGLVVNPHDMPDVAGHEGEGSCGSCHISHSDEPVEEVSEQYCFSCHHEEVFECGTCH